MEALEKLEKIASESPEEKWAGKWIDLSRTTYAPAELTKLPDMALVAISKNIGRNFTSRTISDAKATLWERWKNLIEKSYSVNRTKLYNVGNVTHDDYLQEGYCYFDKAVRNFNVVNADKSNLTSFGTYLFFYVKALEEGYARKGHDRNRIPYNKQVYQSDIIQDDGETGRDYSSYMKAIAVDFEPEEETLNNDAKTLVDGFMESLHTYKERDVLQTLLDGYSKTESAERLGLSVNTIAYMRVTLSLALAKYALAHGYEPDDTTMFRKKADGTWTFKDTMTIHKWRGSNGRAKVGKQKRLSLSTPHAKSLF